MSRYTKQSYVAGELLTASKLNQEYDNIDLLRRTHAGAQAPFEPELGVWWLDTTARPWLLKVYDGVAWVSILQIDATTNQAAIAGGALPAGTVGSGTVLGSYVASGAITDIIMQDGIITESTKINSGTIVVGKTKVGVIDSIHVDSGAVLQKNVKNASISEDQCAHTYATLSGAGTSVAITLNRWAAMPCIQRTSGSADIEWRCKTGTASAGTPGLQLVSTSTTGYKVEYRYFSS